MRRGLIIVTAAAVLCLLASQSPVAAGKIEGAAKEFQRALDLIKAGNDALARGDDERAYDLYDEAITRLNGIKGKYPGWKGETVKKQIKATVAAKKKLEEKTTQSLEQMKQGRFRYLVWQRQRDILNRLSRLNKKLERLSDEIDENQELIKDIRDRMSD